MGGCERATTPLCVRVFNYVRVTWRDCWHSLFCRRMRCWCRMVSRHRMCTRNKAFVEVTDWGLAWHPSHGYNIALALKPCFRNCDWTGLHPNWGHITRTRNLFVHEYTIKSPRKHQGRETLRGRTRRVQGFGACAVLLHYLYLLEEDHRHALTSVRMLLNSCLSGLLLGVDQRLLPSPTSGRHSVSLV